MNDMLRGALAMACVVVALFFFRFWRQSHDRLFLIFSIAFWIFSVHWVGLALQQPGSEARQYSYVARLLAFVMIAIAVIDKNRRPN